ncbi:hypothetical protein T4B_4285 [Trichinella pseudospiralis]|uniref:Uncharacterized protein n=1 Tax=Trichinella pseudospiralis TaxID=6337 RepID=A0A0V1ID66_TRIPS|nr:hypothetical protein T4B_4285 [Trichinella pseudospiralis]
MESVRFEIEKKVVSRDSRSYSRMLQSSFMAGNFCWREISLCSSSYLLTFDFLTDTIGDRDFDRYNRRLEFSRLTVTWLNMHFQAFEMLLFNRKITAQEAERRNIVTE